MTYKVTEENNISTVFLSGEIDMDVTDKAKEVIIPLIEAGKEVHINLKDVEYMDSSGISVLIESHQMGQKRNKQISIKSNHDGKIRANSNDRIMPSISEYKNFEVNSANLKHIRAFAREIFNKSEELKNYQEELVLALAEAAQNVVKHAYNSKPSTDTMKVEINYSEDGLLLIELFDKGKAAIPENIKPRNLDDVKAGGLGTFFIGQIMDQVIFKTSKVDWVNHLILKKQF